MKGSALKKLSTYQLRQLRDYTRKMLDIYEIELEQRERDIEELSPSLLKALDPLIEE